MEASHRSQEFIDTTMLLEKQFREVMKVPENFSVFLVQGGATLQFSAIPFNLMGHKFGEPDGVVNFLRTGYWSEKAGREAGKYLRVNQVNKPASCPEEFYKNVLDLDSWTVDKSAGYFHVCQNETIEGVEYHPEFTRKMIDKIKSVNPEAVIVSD